MERHDVYKGYIIRGRLLGVMHYIFIPKDKKSKPFADTDSDKLIEKIRSESGNRKISLLFFCNLKGKSIEVDNVQVIAPHRVRSGECQSMWRRCHQLANNTVLHVQSDV